MGLRNTKPGTCWITGNKGPTKPTFTLIGKRNIGAVTRKERAAAKDAGKK